MSHWAIVTAAGTSTRFGGGKLTAPFRGIPLLEHCLVVLADAVRDALLAGALVVHRPEDEAVIRMARTYGHRSVGSSESAGGLGETLRAGFAALVRRADSPTIEGALIVPGDQPFLRLEVVAAVLREARSDRAPVIRPVYAEEPVVPGHPVWLARHLWRLVDDLAPEEGLARAIAERGIRVAAVPVPGANPDVDTRAQLAGLEPGNA